MPGDPTPWLRRMTVTEGRGTLGYEGPTCRVDEGQPFGQHRPTHPATYPNVGLGQGPVALPAAGGRPRGSRLADPPRGPPAIGWRDGACPTPSSPSPPRRAPPGRASSWPRAA